MATSLIKKHLTMVFINKGTSDSPEWVQVKKATEFAHSLNPETEERDYIADEQPTTELMQYKPSLSLSVTTIAGEKDFELFYALYIDKLTGEDAKKELLLVYLFDTTSSGGTDYYMAVKSSCTIAVDEFNSVDSTISVSIYENGTPTHGFVTIQDGSPSFQEGDLPAAEAGAAATLSSVNIVGVQEAYGTYSIADSIKAIVQENYLDKLASDYGLGYSGELQSFALEIAASQEIQATLKFACGYSEAHWPSDVTVALPGKYVYLAGQDGGRLTDIEWDYSALEVSAAFTGAHNSSGDGHQEGDEGEHTAGEKAAVAAEGVAVCKTLAKEVADSYLSAPLDFDGQSLSVESGLVVASK